MQVAELVIDFGEFSNELVAVQASQIMLFRQFGGDVHCTRLDERGGEERFRILGTGPVVTAFARGVRSA